jgi:hypothetical protein
MNLCTKFFFLKNLRRLKLYTLYFLKDRGSKCIFHAFSAMPSIFGVVFISVSFLLISPLTKNLDVIGLQLGLNQYIKL